MSEIGLKNITDLNTDKLQETTITRHEKQTMVQHHQNIGRYKVRQAHFTFFTQFAPLANYRASDALEV
jgi:hypothetical protein